MDFTSNKGSPFPGLTIAGELDDLEDLPLEITMTEESIGYLNLLILFKLNENYTGRLSHLQFLPDVTSGEVIVVACTENAYGATEVKYTETENGATVNLRRAVRRFNLQKQPGRVRIFPVTERTAPDGQVYLAFKVKSSETKPSRKLKKAEGTNAGTAAKPAETKPAESQATTPPTTTTVAAEPRKTD